MLVLVVVVAELTVDVDAGKDVGGPSSPQAAVRALMVIKIGKPGVRRIVRQLNRATAAAA